MMRHSHSMSSFIDELTKVAGVGSIERLLAKAKGTGVGKALHGLVNDLKKSPAHRQAVMHSAALGGITGGAAGLVGGGDGSTLGHVARGAAGGALGGAITGVAFPGWFTAPNRRLG